MGIFSYNLRSILEVKRKVNGQEEDLDSEEQDEESKEPEQDDTNNESEENNETDKANDYSMGNVEEDNDESEDENSENDTTNETSEDEESDEEDDNSEANDYSMGDIDEESDEDNTEGEDSEKEDSEDTTEEESSDETEGSENELKSLEDDIFKDIPPEQMNIKIMELKKQYLEVYATITDVLARTNKIPKTSQNMSVLEFIINKLMELKDIVQFYLSNTFDTKTYVENMVNYQQYLATLNTINRLLKEISRKKENNT